MYTEAEYIRDAGPVEVVVWSCRNSLMTSTFRKLQMRSPVKSKDGEGAVGSLRVIFGG